jgi:hypothetical protein
VTTQGSNEIVVQDARQHQGQLVQTSSAGRLRFRLVAR